MLSKVYFAPLILTAGVCLYLLVTRRTSDHRPPAFASITKLGETQVTFHAAPSNFSWTEIFSFVPNGLYDCEQLFRSQGKQKEDILPESFYEAKRKFRSVLAKAKHGEAIEGHSGNFLEETLAYHMLVQALFVETVCETGFNAGHSTLMWLTTNPKARVYSFDIGSHEYSRPMAQYLAEEFPGRLHVTWGDSTVTLPAFRKAHPEVTCDFLIIDGGHSHEVCQSDYDNFKEMANDKSIILLDNYPDKRKTWQKDLGDVWEQAKQKGEIIEIFQCRYMRVPQGFCVGRMNVK